jgi:sugar-phosphatase
MGACIGEGGHMPVRLLQCQAVLFDCDGVLVDSDASVTRAWGAWARTYGLDPDSVVETAHGKPSAETVAALLPVELRRDAAQLIVELERADAHACTAIPGARDLLATFADRPWAVVTSGESVLARARLGAAGISVPAVIVTADDVQRGKPDPQPYLLAASRLGFDIALCLVVEDSAAGVAAARSAGAGGVLGVGPRAVDLDVSAALPDLRGVVAVPDGLQVPTPSV